MRGVVGTHSNMLHDFAGMCRKVRAVTHVAALLNKAHPGKAECASRSAASRPPPPLLGETNKHIHNNQLILNKSVFVSRHGKIRTRESIITAAAVYGHIIFRLRLPRMKRLRRVFCP